MPAGFTPKYIVARTGDKGIAENEKAVADVKDGGKKSKKSMGFLMGQVMQKSRGQANPKVVSQLLAQKLNS